MFDVDDLDDELPSAAVRSRAFDLLVAHRDRLLREAAAAGFSGPPSAATLRRELTEAVDVPAGAAAELAAAARGRRF